MRSTSILVTTSLLFVSTVALGQNGPAPAPGPVPAAPAAPPAAPAPPPAAPAPAAPAPAPASPPATAAGATTPTTTAPPLTPPPSPFPAAPPSTPLQLTVPSTPTGGTNSDSEVMRGNDQEGARTVGLAPPGVNYSNFMDTRLSWTFGDDDILHPTGQLIPLSPSASVGDRPQYRLFFDNLNTRYAGRENLTHLVMYKKMPAFIPHLTTEAAVVLRFDLDALASQTGNLNTALYDSGSYIRLFYNTNEDKPREGISAIFFPLDTDRFRLGYLYDISWGGTNPYINQSIFPSIVGSSPGLKIQYDREGFYAFAGFKTAQIVEPIQILNPGGNNDIEETSVADTNYGFLGGFGIDPIEHIRFDAGAGYFQQGRFDLSDVRGQQVYTYGFSQRLIVHDRLPVPQSIDYRLYRNDPMAPMVLFAPETYDLNHVAWSVSVEGDELEQHLKNFDITGGVKDQPAIAVALQGTLKVGYLTLQATGIYRDLNYVVRNVPGFIPFETIPSSASTQAELFGALSAKYYIKDLRLVPEIGGGVQLPSTFDSVFNDGGIPSNRTIVVRAQGDESILPYDDSRKPIFQGRVQMRWDISDMLKAFVWVQYILDNNGTLVVQDPNEGSASLRVFQAPGRLGLATSLQARF